jgi:hypothetical protein
MPAKVLDQYLFREPSAPIEARAAALILLTPNADLARDPRWGRTQESDGEDPFFNGTIATALIRRRVPQPEIARVNTARLSTRLRGHA